jgi:hypothetical protein
MHGLAVLMSAISLNRHDICRVGSIVDPYGFKADLDPDPAFMINADPDPMN